jgi:PPOX class probable F420-dependent enzyme
MNGTAGPTEKVADMTQIADFSRLVTRDGGLCVVSTLRADGTIQSSVVNAGVLDHPVTGRPVVGLVARGDSRKLVHLRVRPQLTVVVRAGWEWAAAEGRAEPAGPADPLPGLDGGQLPGLLRAVFTAAGGTHDDWDEYDRVMAAEGRTAVLLEPARLYSN